MTASVTKTAGGGEHSREPADWFNFDAWLIDLDGTLYRAGPVRLAMALELALLGVHRIATVRQFRRQQELLRHLAEGLPVNGEAVAASPYHCQLTRTAETLRCPVEHVAEVVAEWMERRPGKWLRLFRRRHLWKELARFKALGGKMALVSDYPAAAKLSALCAVSTFDAVVASGEPGGPTRLKPSPEGYLLAAQRLGTPPDRCLVIGDRDDTDGEAARRAGMSFRHIR